MLTVMTEERRRACRPTLFDAPLTRRFEIRLTEAQYRDLTAVAIEEGKSPSTLVRDAVDSYVGDFRERKLFFLSKRNYTPE